MIKPYYNQDGITIYHADCREVLPHLEPVDLVLTDPPYGIGMDGGKIGFNPKKGMRRENTTRLNIVANSFDKLEWDSKPPDRKIFDIISGMPCDKIIWGGNHFSAFLSNSRCWLVWDKDNGKSTFSDCELAWTSFDKPIRKFRWRWHGFFQEQMAPDVRERKQHPTQKPLRLMNWCLQFVPDSKTILDPFMGSGTTLVAAKQLGRKAIGIEIEEKYCQIAVERLKQGVLDLKTKELK